MYIKRIINNISNGIKSIGFMLKFSWRIGKSRFFWAPLTIIIDSILPLAMLIVPKYIIDELTYSKRSEKVFLYIGLFSAISAFSAIYKWGSRYLQNRSILRVSLENQTDYMKIVLTAEYKNHEDSDYKDLTEKVKKNVNVRNFIDNTLVSFAVNIFQLIGFTYIIVKLHPLILVAIIIIIRINAIIANKREKLGYEFQPIVNKFARKCDYIYGTMIGFESGKDIRINNASSWLERKYRKETANYIESYKKKQNKEFKLSAADSIINALQIIIMYGYSAYMAIAGKITVGSFSIYLGAITSFISSFTGFVSKIISLKYLGYYIEDYKRFCEISQISNDEKTDIDNSITLEELKKGDIEFENVSFRYPNTEKYVLKNISLTIKNGERLSIVGYNGAGKSTFIKLICRLYEPTEGVISLAGHDIKNISYGTYRKALAVVFQDYQLFAFSVKENVIMANEYDYEKLMCSIEKSGLSEKIKNISYGIETSISKEFDEKGIEFSGGEGQKLASARAYYRDAAIVILDEPTASLDPVAESNLYECFNDIVENKTAIYISHRLASVRFCDKVAVFEDGRIIEYGTHKDLLSLGKVYSTMFNTQARYYKEVKQGEED